MAFGALPFVPGGAARAGGARGDRRAGRGRDPLGDDRGAAPTGPSPRPPTSPVPAPTAASPQTYTLTGAHSPEWWCDLVQRATKAMADGAFEKVVLARQVDVTTDQPIDRLAVLERLRASYPGCHIVGIGPLRGGQPRAAGGRGRRHRACPPDGRHRTPRRRPGGRPAPGGLAAGVAHLPPRAPGHHRRRPRHAAQLVLVRGLRGRAVGRGRGQPPAPGDAGRGPPVAAHAVGARPRGGPAPDARRRRPPS